MSAAPARTAPYSQDQTSVTPAIAQVRFGFVAEGRSAQISYAGEIINRIDVPVNPTETELGAIMTGITADLRQKNIPAPPEHVLEQWRQAIAFARETIADVLGRTQDVPTPSASPAPSSGAWPAPMGDAAFHGLVGDFVRVIDPHTESSREAVLTQFLTTFGNVVGRGPYFTVEADRHHMKFFAVLVGASSKARKGTSWGHVLRIFQSAEEEWGKRVQTGLSSGEGLISAVRDVVERQEPIKKGGKVTGYETVIADEGVSDKRLLVFEGEFASVLHVLAREGNTLSAILRSAWDHGDLRTLTRNPLQATGAHISIVGHVTKDELLRYLQSTEMGNGFANRFLWLLAQRSKLLPEGGNIGAVDFAPILRRLRSALNRGREEGEIRRDDEARRLWSEVYAELSEGRPGLLGAVTNRAEAQVTRLSCVYALLDESRVVKLEHLRAALAVWQYAEASARFIFGDAVGDPVADELLNALRAAPDGMTRTDIRDHFGRNKASAQVDSALTALAAAGLAALRNEKTGGRPAERWYALTTKTT